MNAFFEIECPHTAPQDVIRLVGSHQLLGRWDLNDAVMLETSPQKFPWWFTVTPLQFDAEVEFQFAISDRSLLQPVRWETLALTRRLKQANQRKDGQSMDIVFRASWDDPKSTVTIRPSGRPVGHDVRYGISSQQSQGSDAPSRASMATMSTASSVPRALQDSVRQEVVPSRELRPPASASSARVQRISTSLGQQLAMRGSRRLSDPQVLPSDGVVEAAAEREDVRAERGKGGLSPQAVTGARRRMTPTPMVDRGLMEETAGNLGSSGTGTSQLVRPAWPARPGRRPVDVVPVPVSRDQRPEPEVQHPEVEQHHEVEEAATTSTSGPIGMTSTSRMEEIMANVEPKQLETEKTSVVLSKELLPSSTSSTRVQRVAASLGQQLAMRGSRPLQPEAPVLISGVPAVTTRLEEERPQVRAERDDLDTQQVAKATKDLEAPKMKEPEKEKRIEGEKVQPRKKLETDKTSVILSSERLQSTSSSSTGRFSASPKASGGTGSTLSVQQMFTSPSPLEDKESYSYVGSARVRMDQRDHEVRCMHKFVPGDGKGYDYILLDGSYPGDARTGEGDLYRFAMLSLAALEVPLRRTFGEVDNSVRRVVGPSDGREGPQGLGLEKERSLQNQARHDSMSVKATVESGVLIVIISRELPSASPIPREVWPSTSIRPEEGFTYVGFARVRMDQRDHEVRCMHKFVPGEGKGSDYVLLDSASIGSQHSQLYGDTRMAEDYGDNLYRFAMLSLAALEAPLRRNFGRVTSGQRVSHRPEKTADAVPGMPAVFNAPYDYVGTPGNLSQDEAFNRMNLQRRNQTTSPPSPEWSIDQLGDIPVVIVSSELLPWSNSGGLGRVTASLSQQFAMRGHKTMSVAPMYTRPPPEEGFSYIGSAWVRLDQRDHEVRCMHKFVPFGEGKGCDYVLLDHGCYQHRPHGLYCDSRTGQDYGDNLYRFAMLSLAALEVPLRLNFGGVPYGQRVVFLSNDWQAGLVPVYLVHRYRRTGIYRDARTIHIIHNLGYQGKFSAARYNSQSLLGLGEVTDLIKDADLNLCKGAILCADRLVTVSPSYAAEIQSSQGGFGLDDLLVQKARMRRLVGIRNALDEDWDPKTDKHLVRKYDLESFVAGRRECKTALQKKLGLVIAPDAVLFGFVGRLTWQKGVDVLTRAFSWLLTCGMQGLPGRAQVILMGHGEQQYQRLVLDLQLRNRGVVCGYTGYDPSLEHQMMAGCDVIVMPSRYEPCGLPQMAAATYGALVIATATGGLKDTVKGLEDPNASGILIQPPLTEFGLRQALREAAALYFQKPGRFQQLQRNAMSRSFRWESAVDAYEHQLCLALAQGTR